MATLTRGNVYGSDSGSPEVDRLREQNRTLEEQNLELRQALAFVAKAVPQFEFDFTNPRGSAEALYTNLTASQEG